MRRLLPLVLVFALIALAGCGSSSSSTSSSSEGKAEFIAKADTLCEATKAKQEPLRSKVEGLARKARSEEQSTGDVSDGTRQELAQALVQIGAIGEESLAKIDGLSRPEADADQLETILRKTESAFEATRGYGVALEGHQDAMAQKIAEKGAAETRETASLAKQYGFKVCGSKP